MFSVSSADSILVLNVLQIKTDDGQKFYYFHLHMAWAQQRHHNLLTGNLSAASDFYVDLTIAHIKLIALTMLRQLLQNITRELNKSFLNKSSWQVLLEDRIIVFRLST